MKRIKKFKEIESNLINKLETFMEVKYWRYKTKNVDCIFEITEVNGYDNIHLKIYDLDKDSIRNITINSEMLLQTINLKTPEKFLEPASDEVIRKFKDKVNETR
jgi:hypothetical protein